jgi:mRNA interferase MazF
MGEPKRAEIWLVEFDPSVGTEIKKTRPALIISNDIANYKRSKVTLIPITGNIKNIPVVVIIEPDEDNCLTKRSLIMIPDISTFDKIRLKNRIGVLRKEYMNEVDKKLKLHLGLLSTG